MRLVQHKKEAYWFYRFLSNFYDDYVNPLFWNNRMRAEALELAKLDTAGLEVVDVGSGTGFTTQGIARKVPTHRITCIDQSPHQMQRARDKQDLKGCQFLLGDAEALPFAQDRFDRYVSAGSIEYWPEPQRGICEAYRVVKPGGIALMIGPLQPENRLARFLSDTWMLFPPEADYRKWFEKAGFTDIETRYVAPRWVRKEKYGIAISGKKPAPGVSPLKLADRSAESAGERMSFGRGVRFIGRLIIGSIAGFMFIPIALLGYLRQNLRQIINPQSATDYDPITPQLLFTLMVLGTVLLLAVSWFLLR